MKKELKEVAKEIARLEKLIKAGHDVKQHELKMESLMDSLSFMELCEVMLEVEKFLTK